MIDLPIKLAVAAKKGKAISEHFGHAQQFRIYQAIQKQCQWLETREVAHYCLGQHSDQSAKIGDGPTEKLKAIGVQAVSRHAYESIEDLLLDYMQRLAAEEEVA